MKDERGVELRRFESYDPTLVFGKDTAGSLPVEIAALEVINIDELRVNFTPEKVAALIKKASNSLPTLAMILDVLTPEEWKEYCYLLFSLKKSEDNTPNEP